MARAKHTDRSEARRRYRQANLPAGEQDLDLDDSGPPADVAATRSAAKPAQRPASSPPTRPSFLAAMRSAYHRANLREDLRHLPMLLRSRALLAALALVLVGAVAAFAFPGYTGSALAWELLVLPGGALGPQLVAGFFAPRASYILGFIVAMVQSVVYLGVTGMLAARTGTALPPLDPTVLAIQGFIAPALSGALFAAAAAWYRRFLALSSPRRGQAAGRGGARSGAKANPARRPAGR